MTKRSDNRKKAWKRLKALPMVDDEELLKIIYMIIDRGYKGGRYGISAEEMIRLWGKNMRLVFALYEIKAELKSKGYRYWKMDERLLKKIDGFIKLKKLRLTPSRKKGFAGNQYYYYLKRPKDVGK